MTKYKFTIVVTRDPEEEGIFLASVPALPGCNTWGVTEIEAFNNAKDAALCCLESMLQDNEPIAREVRHSQTEVCV
jgi:antitoxin HicB